MSDVATKERPAPNPLVALRTKVERMAPEWKAALPAHIPVAKFQRVVLTSINNNPDLVGADPRSLFNACTRAAQDGLLPDGHEAALVIYGGKAQYLPMLHGLMKLAWNSGEIKSIDALCVRAADRFEYWIDEDGAHLKHYPDPDGEDTPLVRVYAIAITKDGGRYIEVMSKAAVEKIRGVSRAKNSGPWVTWFDRMALKTVMRRLLKRLPRSTDLDDVLRREDEEFDPVNNVVPLEQPEPPAKKGSKLDQFAESTKPSAAQVARETAEDATIVNDDTGEVVDPDTGEVLSDD